MDGTVQGNQELRVTSVSSSQLGNNQLFPSRGANVPLNQQQLPVVPSNSSAPLYQNPSPYGGSHNAPSNSFNAYPPPNSAPPYDNNFSNPSSPFVSQSNWNQQYHPHSSSSVDDARAHIPPPPRQVHIDHPPPARPPQQTRVNYPPPPPRQSSSSPAVNIHIHNSIYTNGAPSSARIQSSNSVNLQSTTPSSFRYQSLNNVNAHRSTPQDPSRTGACGFRCSSHHSVNSSSGGAREPQLYGNSGSSTPSNHNRNTGLRRRDYKSGFRSSPNTANHSSPRVPEIPNSTPIHSRPIQFNQTNQLPSSPYPSDGSGVGSNHMVSNSSTPIATPKPLKEKFKMSMADVERIIGNYSGRAKPGIRGAILNTESKPMMDEKQQQLIEIHLDTHETKAKTDRGANGRTDDTKLETISGTRKPIGSSTTVDNDRKVYDVSAVKEYNPSSLTTGGHRKYDPSAIATTDHKSYTPSAIATTTDQKMFDLSTLNPISATNNKPVIIELSDDESEPETKPPLAAMHESSIIVIDSDDDEYEHKPVEPVKMVKDPIAIDTSLVSSPIIQIKSKPTSEHVSDPIADSSFSFTKIDHTKVPPIRESTEPQKADFNAAITEDGKKTPEDDPLEIPSKPAFIRWLSSDDEDYDFNIPLAKTPTASNVSELKNKPEVLSGIRASTIGKSTERVALKTNGSTAEANTLTPNNTNVASRSRSVPDTQFSRPATESVLGPVKRANTIQDGNSITTKKTKRSKTDSLLEELPKIDNFEYTYKELQDVNRVSRKKEELHSEMEIHISLGPFGILKDLKEDFKLRVSTFDLEFPLIYWKRNAKAEYIKDKDYFIPIKPKKVVQNTFVMYYLAQDFLDKLHSEELKADVVNATEEMCVISTHNYHVILVVEGYDQFINKIKSYKQRQFRSQVLNGEDQARRKKDDERMSKYPTPLEIARLLNRAQLDLKVNIFPVRSRHEGVMWLNSFTYTIGLALYDKYERNQSLANLGVVRSGSDTKATFIQSIQHFPRMTQSKAQILQSSHGSMYLIYSKFRTSGTLGKDALGRNIVPPTVDSTMLSFFTSDDPDKAIT